MGITDTRIMGSKKNVIERMTHLTLAGEFRSLVIALGGTIACLNTGWKLAAPSW